MSAHHLVYPTSNSFEAQIAPKVQNNVVLINEVKSNVLRLNLKAVVIESLEFPDYTVSKNLKI